MICASLWPRSHTFEIKRCVLVVARHSQRSTLAKPVTTHVRAQTRTHQLTHSLKPKPNQSHCSDGLTLPRINRTTRLFPRYWFGVVEARRRLRQRSKHPHGHPVRVTVLIARDPVTCNPSNPRRPTHRQTSGTWSGCRRHAHPSVMTSRRRSLLRVGRLGPETLSPRTTVTWMTIDNTQTTPRDTRGYHACLSVTRTLIYGDGY